MSLHHAAGLDCELCDYKLESAHPILQDWFKTKVKIKFPDAHISWSFRDEQEQEQYFLDKKTELHWPDSPHNFMVDGKPCSKALDLFQIDDTGEGLWNPIFFFRLGEIIKAESDPVFWGGLFKTFGDANHYQIVETDSSPAV